MSNIGVVPQNNLEDAPFRETSDSVERADPELRGVVPTNPNKGYDVRDVLARILDDGEFTEVQAGWAQNILTGYGRIGGRAIGIIANQAKVMAGIVYIGDAIDVPRNTTSTAEFNWWYDPDAAAVALRTN